MPFMAKVEARSAACRYKWKELIGDFHSKLGRTHPDFCFNFNPSEQHPASQELLLVRIAYLLYSNMHGLRFEVTVAAFLIVILTDALIYCSFQQAVRRPPLTIVFILKASLHLERSVFMHFSSLIAPVFALLGAVSGNSLAGRAAQLTQVQNFGDNPSGTGMYIYVPQKLAAKPAVIVAIHFCTGTAQAYYQQSPYSKLADQKGFIVIYPSSPHAGTCWDVSSQKSLKHNGGGDSNAIANMVTYTLKKYNADPKRVFVTGSSSGAMMTNVMASTYPELFAAATAYSGVPAGCFVSSSGQVDAWNSTCAQGNVDQSAAYWTNVVKNMYPGYNGARPRFQIYHGSIDTTLRPNNYRESVKEWTGVFGFDANKPQTVKNNFPANGYTTDIWGVDSANPLGKVQGIYALNVGHTVPISGAQDMAWFGL
ncbi:alpha/beta-hydrolase [Aureobasidium pullulans]|nr:alpha/beta-hydrolase [Aureobasidium pullulans]